MNETAIEHYNNGSWHMDTCLAALKEACPNQRGTSFSCMQCADEHRAAVEAACGVFSDGDNRQGWGVHFYCGIGWSVHLHRSSFCSLCRSRLSAAVLLEAW